MRAILALTLLLSATSAQALEIHSDHYLYGLPEGLSESNDLIFRRAYVLSNNDDTKFADWVAYKLTPRDVWSGPDLERNWRADPHLADNETLEPSPQDDYAGAYSQFKYDRGHLAPLASFKGVFYASEVNYYSNIMPQTKALNRGPWKKLEDKVREYVKEGNEVWVQTGPLYEGAVDQLPGTTEEHKVPSGFWKIVMNKAGSIAAFIMPQIVDSRAPLSDFAVSIDEIEVRTGMSINPEDIDGEAGEAAVSNEWFLE